MKNKHIKYIAFYDVINSESNRYVALSAVNKINFICNTLVKLNFNVNIISPSWSKSRRGLYKGSKIIISKEITLNLFKSFGARIRIMRMLSYLYSCFQLLLFLIRNSKKNEPIIVYHSIILYYPIKIAKLIKKFKLILEVEEIYSDVSLNSNLYRKIEYKMFEIADKFIFSTELLDKKLNKKNKPNVIIYGTYQLEKVRNCSFNDDKIHVVYAGTFDPQKGGITAVAAAEFLPDNYHVHIIGFGTDAQTNKLKEVINETNQKTNATVTYNGLLKGEEYIQFLQKCHIGLSTQVPDANYNDTSFPSKILSYISNGLRVVSIRIKSIEKSAIGQYVFYYEKQTPEEIAKVIMNIDFSQPYNNRDIIQQLDKQFTKNLKCLLKA